jgi:glutamate N-acetyltransferase/amino-acid N-acetyltransferase
MEIPGFKFSTVCAGIKGTQRPDMVLMVSDPPARWSGMFTTNRVKAAPVMLGIERLKSGVPLSAILVNSGNANACNGERGMRDTLALCRETARLLDVPAEQVLMASTGVIGQPLPMEKMRAVLPTLVSGMGQATLKDVAAAIMTTDRYPKWEKETLQDFPDIEVGGVTKGAGMIHPNMATMLGFFFMNAGLSFSDLDRITKRGVEESFNRITVDGDQSTNDTVLVLDNGRLSEEGEVLERAMSGKLIEMMRSLAWKIVDNGEGVTKVITLIVDGAKSPEDARKIAESVGHSPLVKTAFYGEDPNWGRIMAAVGYSGAEMVPEAVDIFFDEISLVSKGQWLGETAERDAAEVMKKRDYTVRIALNQGEETTRLVTSDLSVEYVKINADYRS